MKSGKIELRMAFQNPIFILRMISQEFIQFPDLRNDINGLFWETFAESLDIGLLLFIFCIGLHRLPAGNRKYGRRARPQFLSAPRYSPSFMFNMAILLHPTILSGAAQINILLIKYHFYRSVIQPIYGINVLDKRPDTIIFRVPQEQQSIQCSFRI